MSLEIDETHFANNYYAISFVVLIVILYCVCLNKCHLGINQVVSKLTTHKLFPYPNSLFKLFVLNVHVLYGVQEWHAIRKSTDHLLYGFTNDKPIIR